MTERTHQVHVGCLPLLVLLGLTVAAIYWMAWGGLLLFVHAVSMITEIGAKVP